MPEQAIPYATIAGDRALQMSANEEAVALFRRGLAMLGSLPHGGEHRRLEADLQMGLGTALATADRHAATAVQEALLRAKQLCRELDDLPGLFRSVWGLWRFHLVRGEARIASRTGPRVSSRSHVRRARRLCWLRPMRPWAARSTASVR